MDDDRDKPSDPGLGRSIARIGHRKLPRRAMEAKHFKKKRKQRSNINRWARKHEREANE